MAKPKSTGAGADRLRRAFYCEIERDGPYLLVRHNLYVDVYNT
ncbi:MAG: hypothetical protein ACYTBX_02530 [Planctomycetota bacterium]